MRSYEIFGNSIKLVDIGNHKLKSASKINRNFTGPAQEVVESSSSARIKSVGMLLQYEYLREEVLSAEKVFIRSFYRVLEGMHNTIDVDWVTACKKRHQELFAVFSAITRQESDTEVVILTKNQQVFNLDELTYAPHSYEIKGVDAEDEIIDIYISQTYPKIYGPLFVAMFKVALACKDTRESEPYLFDELKSLAFSLYERGGLYNETNPDDREWKRQELQTLEILTNPPTRKDDDSIMKVFEETLMDIFEGIEYLRVRRRDKVKPYVSEMCAAILATEKYCHSQYNDNDLYFSMASDAAKVEDIEVRKQRITSSLIKSAVEVDPLRDCEFDKHTGYVSHYNKGEYKYPLISTIHIPNPGKFKTRAIHLTLSAVQDRCAYIHNRLSAVLSRIPSDCTKNQSEGILFTLRITNPIWRDDRSWPSVLAFDWSNATDKLWSWFQERVLSIIFDPEIVEFWHQLSTSEKQFKHKDGSITSYKQVNGQPQGLLGSFDAFALAHHIIMLMTMNMSGRTEYLGSEFYRVLGDDSIICSITRDEYNTVGDCYSKICEWCNVPINRTKSTEILCGNSVALVEFAKVYALDGDYFSPIPERLANRIGKHNQDYYAFAAAFWGQRHGMHNRDWIQELIRKYYPEELENHLANVLMFSGLIPAYAELGIEFSDPVLSQTEEAVKLTLCYWYNKIKASFAFSMLNDKAKEKLQFKEKEMHDALIELIPEELEWLFDRIEDSDHKLMKAIQQNLDKEEVVRQLLDCSEDQAIVIAASVKLTDSEVSGIREVIQMLNDIVENPAMLQLYDNLIRHLDEKLSSLERLNYRSVYKRDSLNLMIFRSTIGTYLELFGNNKGLLSIEE